VGGILVFDVVDCVDGFGFDCLVVGEDIKNQSAFGHKSYAHDIS